MNVEAECTKTASKESPFRHSLNKIRFEATQYLLLSGFLTDDGHPRNITKACQLPAVCNAKNLNGIF